MLETSGLNGQHRLCQRYLYNLTSYLLSPGNKIFNPALEDTSLEKDAVMAFEAFYAYITPQPYHLPLVAATGMLLFETDYITEFNFYDHGYQGSRGLRRQGG